MQDLNAPPAMDVEGGVDVSGLVLQDLNAKTDDSVAGGQGISSTPAAALNDPSPSGGDAPEREAVDDLGTNAPGGRRRRTVQDRIDTLTRRYHTAEEEKSILSQQLRQLADVVNQQQHMLQSMRSSAPSAPAPAQPSAGDATFGSLLATGEEQPKPSAGTAAPMPDISRIVEEAIGRYDQKRRQETAEYTQLRNSHEVSFAQAVEEFPELADQRTAFRRTFNNVFDKSPLRVLPDGPYQIALQVRGILADEAGRAARKTEQKRQATVIVPTPSTTDTPDTSRVAIQKEFDKAAAAIRGGDSSYETFRKWRVLRAELQRK